MIAIRSTQPYTAAKEIEAEVKAATPAAADTSSTTEIKPPAENLILANLLSEIARLLADQSASEFRVRAYHNAAQTIADYPHSIRQLHAREGVQGLIELPTIGESIANLIEQYLRLDRIPLLDRLRGEETAERLFSTLPSVGPELSRRIHERLEIETLPELYAAACDGRLEEVPGIGRKRIRAVRECLAERLRRRDPVGELANATPGIDDTVAVSELLDVDHEYRVLAAEGKLPRIAPGRFNPGAVAWLPILHTHRADRHYTALFSNSARAHELNTTHDWVIIYRDDPRAHGRWTVITSQFGKLRGCRIVRGREDECAEFYRRTNCGRF